MGHFWKGRCFQDKCIEMYSTFERQVGFSIRYIVFCHPLSANGGSNGMICRQNVGYVGTVRPYESNLTVLSTPLYSCTRIIENTVIIKTKYRTEKY